MFSCIPDAFECVTSLVHMCDITSMAAVSMRRGLGSRHSRRASCCLSHPRIDCRLGRKVHTLLYLYMYIDAYIYCLIRIYVHRHTHRLLRTNVRIRDIQQKSPTFPPKIPRFLKNKPCISVKEPYISVKEPYISVKDPHFPAK